MNIRDAALDDAAVIIDFQILMARETENLDLDRSRCTAGVLAVFDDPALGRYFVAEERGSVTASLLVTYEWSDWRAARVWWIQSVYVMHTLRGKGVFAAMYAHVKSLVEREGAAGLRLYVDRGNSAAQRVYERVGMNGSHYMLYEWMREF